jgi:hypothetical protein
VLSALCALQEFDGDHSTCLTHLYESRSYYVVGHPFTITLLFAVLSCTGQCILTIAPNMIRCVK